MTEFKTHSSQLAAKAAVQLVEDGMRLGLGSGRTSAMFLEMLAERLRSGSLRDIQGVPTSRQVADMALAWGVPLTSLEEHSSLDLAVDGADEVDPSLNLIKGLGRALLREKIVEIHARRLVIIVDESKIVPYLGHHNPLPVEIAQFEALAQVRWLNSLGCRAELWLEADGSPAVTDNGNYLARCWFDGGIVDPYALSDLLAFRPGIVEHGLFLDMATQVIVGASEGVRVMERGK